MEESEKRKERLKAMRIEADHAEVSSDVETSAMPGCLSNPLSETSSSLTLQDDFCTAPRFDYYTDPMAAFSANKKRGNANNQTMQKSFTSSTTGGWPTARPSSSHPVYSELGGPRNFDQGVYKQGLYSPRITSPSLMHQGHSDAWNGSQATANYYNFVSDGSPRGMFGTPPMHPGTSHRVWNPSNTSRYGNLPSLGFSPAESRNFSYGTARPQMFGNPTLDQGPGGNPGFSSGRGRGCGYSGSSGPGIGRSGGRGQGFHGRSSASSRRLGPECFFDESMLEDPWQHLKPIPWRRQEAGMDSLSTPGTSNSWLPKSIGIKRAKVSEASNKFNSQSSLAEYLAASFNKAVEDTQNA